MLQHSLIRDGYDHIYHLLLARKFEQWLRTRHAVDWLEIQANTWPLSRRQRRNLFELPFRFMRRHLEDGDYGLATNALQIYFDPLPPERPHIMMNYIAGPSGHEYVVLHDAKDPRHRLDWDRYRLGRYLTLLERLAVRRLSVIRSEEFQREKRQEVLLFVDYGRIQVYRRYSPSGIRTFSPFEYTLLADLADADLEPSQSRWIFDVRDLPSPPDNGKSSISIGSVTVDVGLTAPKVEQHRTIIKHAIDAGVITGAGVQPERGLESMLPPCSC